MPRTKKRILIILPLLAGLALTVLFPARPAYAGMFDFMDGRKACIEKYLPKAKTNFTAGFYEQVCDILNEEEPQIDHAFQLAPIAKPRDCTDYSPSHYYITPSELHECGMDRWKMRQKWAKCRLDKDDTPEAQTGHAIDIILFGADDSECGPYADKINPKETVATACIWPVCPFWTLNGVTADTVTDKTDMGLAQHDSSALCAEIRDTVNAMIALHDTDPTGYKDLESYKTLQKHIDDSPYPKLPCPQNLP